MSGISEGKMLAEIDTCGMPRAGQDTCGMPRDHTPRPSSGRLLCPAGEQMTATTYQQQPLVSVDNSNENCHFITFTILIARYHYELCVILFIIDLKLQT